MLLHLGVKDLALLEDVSLDFDGGFNVLTGETGAGKSLLLDALGLVLGGRSSAELVRHGCQKAVVTALFRIDPQRADLQHLLEGWGIPLEEELLIRREVQANGRSRAWINGQVTTAGALNQAAPLLGVIHGQHASYALARQDQHLHLLDRYAGSAEDCKQVQIRHQSLGDAREAVRAFQTSLQEKELRLGHLELQLKEIAAVAPKADEEPDLESEAALLSSGDRLLEAYQGILGALQGGEQEGANSLLGQVIAHLEDAAQSNPALTDWLQQAREAQQFFLELDQAVTDFGAETRPDPERLDFVLTRLRQLQDLRRKYGPELKDVIRRWQSLEEEASALGAGDERLEALNRELEAAQRAYQSAAEALGQKRRKASPVMARDIAQRLQPLGLPKARFQIDFESRGQDHPLGLETVQFMLSANPGNPPQPVQKVASGGEMSRLMLSILLSLHQATGQAALVFDEIDAGIGGRTAETVGEGLQDLGRTRQVLCVTHLPQVAARADRHIVVSKQQGEDSTEVAFTPLEPAAREQEIARMLGDSLAEDTALEHARALLKVRRGP